MKGGVPRADIEKRLRVKFRQTILYDPGMAIHSLNRGVPAVMSHPRSGLARGISRLAELLAVEARENGATDEVTEGEPSAGLLGRLMRRRRT